MCDFSDNEEVNDFSSALDKVIELNGGEKPEDFDELVAYTKRLEELVNEGNRFIGNYVTEVMNRVKAASIHGVNKVGQAYFQTEDLLELLTDGLLVLLEDFTNEKTIEGYQTPIGTQFARVFIRTAAEEVIPGFSSENSAKYQFMKEVYETRLDPAQVFLRRAGLEPVVLGLDELSEADSLADFLVSDPREERGY